MGIRITLATAFLGAAVFYFFDIPHIDIPSGASLQTMIDYKAVPLNSGATGFFLGMGVTLLLAHKIVRFLDD